MESAIQRAMLMKQTELNQFTGTNQYFKHTLSGYVYTDGVKYLADKAGAYWLIDKILIITRYKKKLQEFGVWKLSVNDDKIAMLICEDGNGKKQYEEKLDYTDFSMKEVSIWFQNETLFLPSEY